jgi:threonine dehydratase
VNTETGTTPENTPLSPPAAGELLVNFHDVVSAQERIKRHVVHTPVHRYPLLDAQLGAEVWIKHENHQMIGCFKARGAINAILAATNSFEGVVASSSGNHGQGVAYAAKMTGTNATIVVPEWAYPHKVAAIEALDARVEFCGTTSHQGRERAAQLADSEGLLLLDDFDDPFIVAGNGTIALELLEERPDLDILVIPLGGGALAAGCGVVAKTINPLLRTIAGQSEECPATSASWRERRPMQMPCSTIADGLAVDFPDATVVEMLVEYIDEVTLVSEAEIRHAVGLMLQTTRNVVEPSGAVPIAVCRKRREDFAGRRVGVIATGGNIDLAILHQSVTDLLS